MDKSIEYKAILKSYLGEKAKETIPNAPALVGKLVVDESQNHFMLFRSGLVDNEFKHILVFHFEIINNQVYIFENRTDLDIQLKLIELGIPASEIVIPSEMPSAINS